MQRAGQAAARILLAVGSNAPRPSWYPSLQPSTPHRSSSWRMCSWCGTTAARCARLRFAAVHISQCAVHPVDPAGRVNAPLILRSQLAPQLPHFPLPALPACCMPTCPPVQLPTASSPAVQRARRSSGGRGRPGGGVLETGKAQHHSWSRAVLLGSWFATAGRLSCTSTHSHHVFCYWVQCWAATGIQVSNRELEAQNAARQAAKAAAAAEKLDAAWRAAARKVGRCASGRACFWKRHS